MLIATGSVEEVLSRAATLDAPPETLTLTLRGTEWGPALARITLDRVLGSRIDVEKGQQPYERAALDGVEQLLDRRQPGASWLVRPTNFFLHSAVIVLYLLTLLTLYLTLRDKVLWYFGAQLLCVVALFAASRFLQKWRAGLPRFELRAPGQGDTLTEIELRARRVLWGLLGGAVINILTSAVSLSRQG